MASWHGMNWDSYRQQWSYGVSGFSGMGIVEWWNGETVERWNGKMDACVESSTLLVQVGNNCIGIVAEISIMGR